MYGTSYARLVRIILFPVQIHHKEALSGGVGLRWGADVPRLCACLSWFPALVPAVSTGLPLRIFVTRRH